MVEVFNKLVELDEKKFRDFCKNNSKIRNKKSSLKIASSLFHLASECEFEKISQLLGLIKENEIYLSNLIKSNFPYCYVIGNFSEEERFKSKAKLSYNQKSQNIKKELIKNNIMKTYLVFSNDLRSHLGGCSIIPYLKLIKYNLDSKFFLLTKNSSQIKYLKDFETGLFDYYFDYREVVKNGLNKYYFDILIDSTGNLLNSNLAFNVPHIKKLNIWGYPGTMGSSKNEYVLLDKNFQNTSIVNYYTETICYLPCLQSMTIKDNIKRAKNYKFKNRLGIFSNTYKLNYEILIELFKLIKLENMILYFGPMNIKAKRNLFKLAKSFAVEENIQFSVDFDYNLYLKSLENIDILIDIPFLGGSRSVIDAISSGTPVVTLEGIRSEEKNGSSILKDLSLGEFIAKDIKELPKIIMNIVKNYDLFRDKIISSLSQEQKRCREDAFINAFSKIV